MSSLATALALTFGLAAALFASAISTRAQRVVLVLAILALALPPFVVVNSWLHYFGATGSLRNSIRIDIFNIGGVAWLLALMLWPIPFAALWSRWRSLAAAYFEAEPSLAGCALLRWLLLPSARNAIAVAAVLTFTLALNQFSIPAILQVKVLPVEFWIRFSTDLRADKALAACWPLIAVPFVAWLLLRHANLGWPAEAPRPDAPVFRRQLGGRLFAISASMTVVVLVLSVGLPLFQLLTAPRTWAELPQVFNATVPVIRNTFLYAGGAALTALAAGAVLWRFRAASLALLLFFTPGMLLAVGLIWLLNRPGLEVIYRSAMVVVIALGLRYLGPVWALLRQRLRTTDSALLDAARLEGLRGWSLFRHVYWPAVAPTALVAWYVAYLLCLWDVETITLLYPPGSETLALRAFNLLHYGHAAQVNGICLLLLALALGPAVGWLLLRLTLYRRTVPVALSPTNPTLQR